MFWQQKMRKHNIKWIEKNKGYNMIGGSKNRKKNSSWKLNHALQKQDQAAMKINSTLKDAKNRTKDTIKPEKEEYEK